jgi:hypothetical protein
MPPVFGTLSPGEEAEIPPNILDKLAASTINGLATLPQRAIEAAQQHAAQTYGPGTVSDSDLPPLNPLIPIGVEAATHTMGGTSLGAPARAGEMTLGAGPVRKVAAELPMDEASRMARAADQGFTIDAYHATRAPEFDAFKRKPNDIGMHFGTAEQANDRLDYTRRPYYGAELDPPERLLPVKLAIKNPLRMDDIGGWGSDNLLYALRNHPEFDAEAVRRAATSAGNESGRVAALRDLIKQKGYDGIVYKNTGEVAGSDPYRKAIADARIKLNEAFGEKKSSFSVEDQKHPAYQEWSDAQKAYTDYREANGQDSYIAFHPSQVRSKFAAFDPANEGKGMLLGAGAGDRRGAVATPLAAAMADRPGASALAEPYHQLIEPSSTSQAYERLQKILDPNSDFKVPPLKRGYNAGVESSPDPLLQTVADPFRNHFPGVYGNPREIAGEAAARVIPEDPALHRLWGVNRSDLDQIALGRVGNEEPNLRLAKNPRGSLAAQNIQTPQNTQRLIDILGEAGKYPGLAHADAWYVLDPMFQRLEQMFGREEAVKRFQHLNTMTGMASPSSDVMTEIQRGTGAHWLEQQGRFDDFPEICRGAGRVPGTQAFPDDMRYIAGHPTTGPRKASRWRNTSRHGSIQSDAPKVPLYVHASGVPETGFQTSGPLATPISPAAWGLPTPARAQPTSQAPSRCRNTRPCSHGGSTRWRARSGSRVCRRRRGYGRRWGRKRASNHRSVRVNWSCSRGRSCGRRSGCGFPRRRRAT